MWQSNENGGVTHAKTRRLAAVSDCQIATTYGLFLHSYTARRVMRYDDVLPPVQALFEMVEREEGRDELEIELRFGRVGEHGNFVPGMPREFIDNAIRRLMTNPDCRSSEWTEHEDYFYSIDTAPGDRQQVRTRVTFDPYELCIKVAHVRKKRLASVMLQAGDVALKIALSRETPVSASLLPTASETDMVRIQQRKSILWSRQKSKSPPWRYESSLTWTGVTKSEVESTRYNQGGCTNEFEIELDLKSPYVACHSSKYLAESMLLKAADFIDTHSNLVLRKRDLPSNSCTSR